MSLFKFLGRRTIYLFFQIVGVVTITFFLVRIIPGNPAQALAGMGASKESVESIERQLGLDQPLPVQYVYFWRDLLHGDLGDSLRTGQPVIEDLKQRVPATLELVLISMFFCIVIGIPLGIFVALRKGGILERIVFVYGMLAGGLPDFWLGLILVFIFFFLLGWVPSPLGRLGIGTPPPKTVTGFYLIDSALHGDWETFKVAAIHLVLPVATLVLVNMSQILKMTRSSMEEVAGSEFMEYARAYGFPRGPKLRYQLRNALAPVATVVAFTTGFLLAGSVLVETVFSWGGLGQYAVQSVVTADYWPLQGFVLVAAAFMAINYLTLDIVYALIDPRVRIG